MWKLFVPFQVVKFNTICTYSVLIYIHYKYQFNINISSKLVLEPMTALLHSNISTELQLRKGL